LVFDWSEREKNFFQKKKNVGLSEFLALNVREREGACIPVDRECRLFFIRTAVSVGKMSAELSIYG